ncbi:uncharacterized protein LOC114373115 [Glycine soja]|uniref:uncharacterized protein LOC114373115 n=1 Tax=Glycine soja TaxID=3848 RepID=UPI00103C29EC|nr:uncharacterized protein LOC114373115 [Glycine soja]
MDTVSYKATNSSSGTSSSSRKGAYPLETDDHGQSESLNLFLEAYLRCFTGDFPKRWYNILHLAKYWYNSTKHSAIGMMPSLALYGRSPSGLTDYLPGSVSLPNVDETLQDRQIVGKQHRETLRSTRKRMVAQSNNHWRDILFQEGDWELLKLCPYQHHSMARRGS